MTGNHNKWLIEMCPNSSVTGAMTPCSENHEKKYGIPTLEELGQDAAALGEEQFPGGEQEALRRLDKHMKTTVLCFLSFQKHKYALPLVYNVHLTSISK